MSEIWYHTRNGEQVGPVTLDEVRRRASAGELTPTDMVWREGMPDWIDARLAPEVAAAFGSTAPAQGPYDYQPAQAPPPAGHAIPYAAAPYPAAAYPGGVLPYSTPSFNVYYAGFWIRFVAVIVDGIITAIPGFIFGTIIGMAAVSTGGQPNLAVSLLTNVISIVISWLYEALFTASKYQATPGKMLVGIRVTDVHGNQISFGRATGRHFAKILSGLILLIGYIMAAFDAQKRALHDQMAGTLVTYK